MYFSKKIEDLLENAKSSVSNERIALGLTQKEFADFIGLKYATYAKLEEMIYESYLEELYSL